MTNINKVSIKFKPGAYHAFRNLQNTSWYALGEYVDNAVQSFENNKIALEKAAKGKYQFEVKINVDWEKDLIRIYDNACGIDAANFERAFEPANIPLDNTGLHEFGMGMKTASIWLSNLWTVRTAALDEGVERFVEFDLKKVMAEEREDLKVNNTSVPKSTHFTELVLSQISRNAPSPHQMDKVKKHLASIYRKFIRSGAMRLVINDEEMSFKDPEILSAPFYSTPRGEKVEWKQEIDFSFGKYTAKGFIAILNTMSTSEVNGLSLFRRGRVIEGSHDEKYRPKAVCGNVGSPRYKRIFGELELEGFNVSFNKGSFQEHEDLEALMDALRIEISNKEFDIYAQAEKYLKPKAPEDDQQAAKNILNTLKREEQQQTLTQKVDASLQKTEGKTQEANAELVKKAKAIDSHEAIFTIRGEKYKLKVEMIMEPSILDLYTLTIEDDELVSKKAIYKINLAHPLFTRFEQLKGEDGCEPITLFIQSLVLAEIVAPLQGTKNAGNIRANFNKYLRSEPNE